MYGLSDLAIIDPGATILRRFISDELDVLLDHQNGLPTVSGEKTGLVAKVALAT